MNTCVLRIIIDDEQVHLTADVDDNKFVDCAIVANADFIVSNDSHFKVLKSIPFPHVEVRSLEEFLQELKIEY